MAFVKFKDICGDLFIPAPQKNNKSAILWLPGLPNKPSVEDMGQPLADLGFTILQLRYPGNWESKGAFGPSTSLEGAIQGLELLASGESYDQLKKKNVHWDTERLFIAGNSYGGAIALSALAKSSLAEGAVCFCPLLEPHLQNVYKNEEDLQALYSYITKEHSTDYREFNEQEWKRFMDGNHQVNPSQYIEQLKDEPILLIHGASDTSILPYHTIDFFHKLTEAGSCSAELKIITGKGHGKGLRNAATEIWTEWLFNDSHSCI